MADTETCLARDRVIRLRQGLRDCLSDARGPLRHAIRLRNNEDLLSPGELEAWSRVAPPRDSGGQELVLLGSRDVPCNSLRRGLIHTFFGPAGHRGELDRFTGLAGEAFDAASDLLRCQGRDDELVTTGLMSREPRPDERAYYWVHACYNLAWDNPGRLNYQVQGRSLPDDKRLWTPGLPQAPFTDRGRFEEWGRPQGTDPRSPSGLPPGLYWLWLSQDVRHCSVEAIDLILDLAPAEPPARPPVWERMELSKEGPDSCYCKLDGTRHPIRHDAYLWLHALAEAKGHHVAMRQIPGLENVRASRIRHLLPRAILDHIKTEDRKGSRLVE